MKDYEKIISTLLAKIAELEKVVKQQGAKVVYYLNQHFIPEDRLQQLFSDLYGVQLATATIAGYNQIAFDALAPFEAAILSSIKVAAVKNLDETGFRVGGKTQFATISL